MIHFFHHPQHVADVDFGALGDVPGMDDQVRVEGGDVAPCGVVAIVPALAAGDGKPQCGQGVGRGGRARR